MKCAACSERDDEGRLLERCVENRKRWACDAPIPEGEKPLLSEEEMETTLPLRRCPWAEAVPRMRPVLPFLELAHEQGHLPAAGGMLDQTADFKEALIRYGSLKARIEREAIEEAENRSRIKT